jgi:hypothetical protein
MKYYIQTPKEIDLLTVSGSFYWLTANTGVGNRSALTAPSSVLCPPLLSGGARGRSINQVQQEIKKIAEILFAVSGGSL